MSMEELFGSGSDSDVGSIGGRKLSTASTGGEDEELPSTQAHVNELFGAESDDNNSKDGSDDNSSNSGTPSNNSGSGIDEPQQKGDEVEQDLLFGNNDEEMENSERTNTKPDLSSSSDNDDDQGVGQEKDKPMEPLPTTQDLFGEEFDVSSDDDDDIPKPKPKIDEDYDSANDMGEKEKAPPDEDERPPSPEKEEEEEEGLSISIELPRCNIALGKELYFIKLPNFLSVDTKPFDTNIYEDEIDEDEILDEEGRARLKLKVENTIRWRYSKDKDGNEIKESNCRFVRWSDGSLSMHLGNEVFDVFKMAVEGEQNHLFVQQGTGLQAQAVFKNKLSFRPHSTTSQTHRKMTMSIADRMSKAQKIKMMPATERDPETSRVSLIKKEDERLRAASRRESQQRRIREKNHLKGLSTGYLDQDMDDEEDFEGSLSAITNKYKQDLKNARSKPIEDIYSDEEDSENEDKLRSAKLDIESDDDDDEEIRQKREELARKKKSSRKVIEESDEEESE